MGGSALADLVVGVRFLRALPSFVRTRITPEQARFALRHRLEHRQARFLAMVRQAVYEHPGSPYRESAVANLMGKQAAQPIGTRPKCPMISSAGLRRRRALDARL